MAQDMSDNQANKANRLSDLEMNMNGMSDNRLTELTCYQTATSSNRATRANNLSHKRSWVRQIG